MSFTFCQASWLDHWGFWYIPYSWATPWNCLVGRYVGCVPYLHLDLIWQYYFWDSNSSCFFLLAPWYTRSAPGYSPRYFQPPLSHSYCFWPDTRPSPFLLASQVNQSLWSTFLKSYCCWSTYFYSAPTRTYCSIFISAKFLRSWYGNAAIWLGSC